VKVLLIPEDQTHDQYIIKPVIEALFADLELPARISVLPEPRLRGYAQALDPEMIRGIVQDNPMEDLFLLLVDRDCDRNHAEAKAAAIQKEHASKLFCCLAIQEIEVWMLALHSDSLDTPLSEIREHCDPKEIWAEPLLKRLGTDGPGAGRKKAMRALQGQWRSLRDRCPELRSLQVEIAAWRETQSNAGS
jgi:hypothetical protein